jgi:hypothetical protein
MNQLTLQQAAGGAGGAGGAAIAGSNQIYHVTTKDVLYVMYFGTIFLTSTSSKTSSVRKESLKIMLVDAS